MRSEVLSPQPGNDPLAQAVIDSLSGPVFLADENGGFISLYSDASSTLGYTREEFLAIGSVRSLFGADVVPDAGALSRNGEWHEFDAHATDKSGIVRAFRVRAKRVTAPRTSILYACRDTTDEWAGDGEDLLRRRLRLLEYAERHSLEQVLRKTVDELGEIVESPIGFYHFVEPDERTISPQTWSTRTLKEFCTARERGMQCTVEQAGVWVDCVRRRRGVIHNDYASLPHRRGMPAGHARLDRELVVPIFRGGRIVAILGVGNKPFDYTEEDLHAVTYLADVAWEIVERKRAEAHVRLLLKQQQAVNRLALSLGSLTDLPSIYRLLCDEVHGLMDAYGFFLSRFDKEAGVIVALYAGGDVESDVSTLPALPLAAEGGGMQSQVLRSGRPLYVPDWAAHESQMNALYYVPDEGAPTSSLPSPGDREGDTKSALLVPMVIRGEPVGVMQVQSRRLDAYSEDDVQLLAGIANVAAVAIENARLLSQLNRSLEGTIRALALSAETRDPYTAGHQERVAALSCALAAELGLPDDAIRGLRVAGLLHDIGKLCVPSEILSKPSRLTPIETSLIREHPAKADAILADVPFPWPVTSMILQHHERLDGTGYPHGLAGAEIMLEARILAVADVVEAMASHRPYRPALGIQSAMDEIAAGRGCLYDPDVVDACQRLFTEGRFRFEV